MSPYLLALRLRRIRHTTDLLRALRADRALPGSPNLPF